MKTKTQKDRLIEALKNQKLSTYSAAVKRLTTKLPTRAGELKEEGWNVKIKENKPKGIAKHNLYWIAKPYKK